MGKGDSQFAAVELAGQEVAGEYRRAAAVALLEEAQARVLGIQTKLHQWAMRSLIWTGGEPVARQRARRVRRRGSEKRTIARARHRAPARPLLRLPTLPAGAAPTRDHAQDRPAWGGVQPAAGPPPLCGGAVAGVAGGLPALAGALRAAHRHRIGVRAAGVRVGLPQLTDQMTRTSGPRRGHPSPLTAADASGDGRVGGARLRKATTRDPDD